LERKQYVEEKMENNNLKQYINFVLKVLGSFGRLQFSTNMKSLQIPKTTFIYVWKNDVYWNKLAMWICLTLSLKYYAFQNN